MYELSEKDKALKELEARIEGMEAAAGPRLRAGSTGEPNPDEVVKPKKEKKELKKQKREEDRQLKKLKREKRLERKELKIAKSKLVKRAEFNQGLRLVDLVAESKSLELKDASIHPSLINSSALI